MGMTKTELRQLRERMSIRNLPELQNPFERTDTVSTQPGTGGFQPGMGEHHVMDETWADDALLGEVEPNAAELGGALEEEDPNFITEIGPDMKPRRVPRPPGPQSGVGNFGDAAGLVDAIRQQRLGQLAARQSKTKTFGELAGIARQEQEERDNQEALAANDAARQQEELMTLLKGVLG